MITVVFGLLKVYISPASRKCVRNILVIFAVIVSYF
jgi:hypothetical protein